MRWRALVRRTLTALFVVLGFTLACSRQSEGERCSRDNNDDDCESGLVCVAGAELRGNDGVDRCCPPEGEEPGDARCVRGGTGTGSGGTGGGDAGSDASDAGTGGAGGDDAGPDTGAIECSYASQCPVGQTCSPQGMCQAECLADRDCQGGEVCSDAGACVAGAGGSGG